MDEPRHRVSVVTPIAQAWDRMTRYAFKPFDLTRWCGLGVALLLIGLWGDVLHLGNTVLSFVPEQLLFSAYHPGQSLHDYLNRHGGSIAALVGAVTGVGLILYAFCTFFACRGQFMLMHGLIQNTGEVQAPWRQWASRANALWVFKVVLAASFCVINAVTAGVFLLIVWPDIAAGLMSDRAAWAIVISVSWLTIVWLLYLKGMVVTTDFIVPMMVAQDIGPWRAWWVWLSVFLRHDMWAILLFYLLRMVFASAIGSIGFLACCTTCGLGGLPYLKSVILLPALAFDRLYSACFVEQFGEQWLMFPQADAEHPICPGCRYDLRGNPDASNCPECGYDLTRIPKGDEVDK